MRMKIIVFLIAISLIIVTTLHLLVNNQKDFQIVGSSDTFATISANHQRKLFYANGFHWIFFCNGSQIFYSSSSDGIGWSKPVAFENSSSSSSISIWFDQKVYYVYAPGDPGSSVLYRSGEIVGEKIEWEEYHTAIEGFIGPTYFLTNRIAYNKTLIMDSSSPLQKDVQTLIRVGNTLDQYFVFRPGEETMSSIGESLPITCTGLGWVSAERILIQAIDGPWEFQVNLINEEETDHSGTIFVRLWKFRDGNKSGATPLTDWIEGNKIHFSDQHEEKTAKIHVLMANITFANEFLFVEFGWKVDNSTSSLAGVRLECGNLSRIEAPSYRYFNGYCIKDSFEYPWAACIGNDGAFWHAYVVKAQVTDGSVWGQPERILGPLVQQKRVSILPLDDGKVYAICGGIDGVQGRLWNGSSWESEEVITSTSLVVEYGYSAVSHDGRVHLALLENSTHNVLYLMRSDEINWEEEVVEKGLDNRSLPAICVDESNGNLYCFWIYHNIIWLKEKANGVWKGSSHPFGVDFGELRGISCFYRVFDGKVGVAWLEQRDNLYEVKYRFLLV